ncbi:tRNA uridine-5-carboxymethylaminomethyl(34) synthesis GTPase MnmE [Paracoccus sp. T5]|uniref:tRNA uridine-5-carboxymethylaminomethyl(34) synthesis GTPase MnmE n=1 Tax=Paracoccus sp. T5 TaxID=3402161 RepID=UPI003AEAE23A
MDLIFAEATPPGRGGVSVIRLSGDGARAAAESLVGPMPQARRSYFRDLTEGGEPVDQVLALWFAAGASFTGEEVAELHLHGAPVVARRVAVALQNLGARVADAGEFTRRAFLNGRMDLAEIEGLGDLLAAETESQRKLALRAAGGEMARRAEAWRDLLIEAGALVEVTVDFADEDVPDEVPPRVFDIVTDLVRQIQRELDGFGAAERVRQGFEVAIIGPPNAGKSSLMNSLARRDVAIVSEVAGTTRDVIEVRMDLQGLAVTLLDTAGIREAGDTVEAVGIARARGRAEAADLRIHLSPTAEPVAGMWQDEDLLVQSKADLAASCPGLAISAVSGEGLDQLMQAVFEILSNRSSNAGLVSHERQNAELRDAKSSLDEVYDAPVELIAESLRRANAALDRLLGRIDAEDYLDRIFSSFCIGK